VGVLTGQGGLNDYLFLDCFLDRYTYYTLLFIIEKNYIYVYRILFGLLRTLRNSIGSVDI